MQRPKPSCLVPILVTALLSVPRPTLGQLPRPAKDASRISVFPHDRVVLPVEDTERVTLPGDAPPQALPAYETGTVEPGLRIDHILLLLKPDMVQQRALDALVQAQQDPGSDLYRHWLTPENYAAHFGVSDADIEQVASWLRRYGLQVDEVAASHRTLAFSGSAAQVEAAFQTPLRAYRMAGEHHIANAADPSIPAALAEVVGGVVSLHDFFSQPQHASRRVSPEFYDSGSHYLSPADFATIYDVAPLYGQAYDGSGETIAIVGRADIGLSAVRSFRSQFGLPAKDPVVLVNGADPASSARGDVDESMLDVEWSGAVARRATIEFVTSASTAVSDGVFLSAQYIVDHNLAPIMSVSYGLCEAALGAGGNAFLNALWEQAAAEGITVLVSAGDSGAAGCDAPSEIKATRGRGVNGLCSTPYSTCVGGTEFKDAANPGLYWNNANGGTGGSALGYIPETTWNESGDGGLWSTGGGISTVYTKPSWQAGPGVSADGRRDVPDVSLTAAAHDGYLVRLADGLYVFRGTSAGAPSFAGLLALAAQRAESRLGNANPGLYALAARQRASGASGALTVFHDTVTGNNGVPGVAGYSASIGYDRTTGLGSVDAERLVSAWSEAGGPSTTAPGFSISLSSTSLSLTRGGTARIDVATTSSGGFDAPITLNVDTLGGAPPAGLSADFSPVKIAAPGKGSSVLTLTASKTALLGAGRLTVTASGGGLSQSSDVALEVIAGNSTGDPLRPVVPPLR